MLQASSWAMDLTGVTPEEKLVMILAGDGASPADMSGAADLSMGLIYFTSPEELAAEACMSVERLQQVLAELKQRGLAKWGEYEGPQGSRSEGLWFAIG